MQVRTNREVVGVGGGVELFLCITGVCLLVACEAPCVFTRLASRKIERLVVRR